MVERNLCDRIKNFPEGALTRELDGETVRVFDVPSLGGTVCPYSGNPCSEKTICQGYIAERVGEQVQGYSGTLVSEEAFEILSGDNLLQVKKYTP